MKLARRFIAVQINNNPERVNIKFDTIIYVQIIALIKTGRKQ